MEFIEVVAALSRLGIITVPIMPIYRRDEVGYVVGHAEARAVITRRHSKFRLPGHAP